MIFVTESLLFLGLVIGHAALAVGFLNRVHGLGLNPQWMNRVSLVPLVVPALVAVWCTYILATQGFTSSNIQSRIFLGYVAICNMVTWVVLPVITLERWYRRLPGFVQMHTETVPFDPALAAQSWIGEGKHNWLLRLPRNESLSLQIRNWDLGLPALPYSFKPLRILHLSDFHFAHCYSVEYFKAVAQATIGWNADLVCFTGDLLDDETTLDWTLPVFSLLRGRLGQFAILGNHDVEHRPGRVRRALRSAGFTVIDGRWMTIQHEGHTIGLGGTSAPWGPQLDPLDRPDADATLVMSHSPDQFPALARWKTVDLVLTGHNHGGQIRFPGLGAIVTPSRYGRRYDRGIFQRGKTLMEVTQGVGGKHPIRYGCPPEIVRMVLQPVAESNHEIKQSKLLLDRSYT